MFSIADLRSMLHPQPVAVDTESALGTLHVHLMTGAAHVRATMGAMVGEGEQKVMDGGRWIMHVIAETVRDAEGAAVFTAESAAELPREIMDKLFSASSALNKLGAGAVEDASKNSDATPSGASTSDSPAT